LRASPISGSNSNTSNSSNTSNTQNVTPDFSKTLELMIKDIGVWVSLLVLPVLSFVSKIIFKKDVPNQFLLIINMFSVFIILSLQIANLYAPNFLKYIVCLFGVLISIYVLIIKYKYEETKLALEDINVKKLNNHINKAKKYIDNIMSHRLNNGIESIQLYENKIKNDIINEISLNFIYGKARESVEINAILSTCYTVDKIIIDEFNIVLNMFRDYQDDAPAIAYRKAIANKVEHNISLLMAELKKIDDTENITKEHLCITRIIVLYLTIIDALDKESTYIGLDIKSLGIDSTIEKALFTKMRTGILGSILLKEYPYLFYYKKDGWKKDRVYLSFYLGGTSKSYVVLISLKKFPGKELFNTSLNKALRGIESDLRHILSNE
jgi:hypothetical protein